LITSRRGPRKPSREQGDEAADRARREIRPEVSDVVIKLTNSDDDATMIFAEVKYEFAEQWADATGSIAGGTWEGTGEPGFVYDLVCWHPALVDELVAGGYRLDLSEYSDPDAEDIARAIAAAE
jgi:hypothetical protein